ncbi:hypothetical protein [Ectobacillus panaciterrae]|uniref:hypothetical protein n=1 Tax=Ectobacillus panaciterrae TaxID=363872 RepID=UPI00041086B6|nr:hypothetical protein [Ectobacillus panaciterrae]
METKKKTRKAWKWFILLPILSIILFVGLRTADFGGWGHRSNFAIHQNHQAFFNKGGEANRFEALQQGEFHMQGRGNGPHSFEQGFSPDRFHHRGEHRGFGFIPFLFGLVLFILGWFVRKSADGSTWKKWTGTFLMFLALLPIMPFILIALAIYWLYKIWKKNRMNEDITVEPFLSPVHAGVSRNADILDEWERNITKEDK